MEKKTKKLGLVITFLPLIYLLLLTNQLAFGQTSDKKEWTILSEDDKVVESTDTTFLGKPCIKLDGHSKAVAWKKEANYKNFRIDLDIAGAVMPGVGFRVANEQNYQFLYFRPGYGGTEEAIQYIPIYNGALSWVFYGAYQNVADIKRLEWFHATLEVRGNNLKVFTNYNKKPDMNINLLKTEVEKGSILLRSMFGIAYFANVSIRELPESINDWEISEQFPRNATYDYSQAKKVNKWTKINEKSDDYVNLCRYFEFPEGVLLAKHTIHAEADEAQSLNFDFIGKIQVYLNGKEVYNYGKYILDRTANNTNKIRLNLKKGNNELLLITEGDAFIFGNGAGFKSIGRLQHQNWGFIANLEK